MSTGKQAFFEGGEKEMGAEDDRNRDRRDFHRLPVGFLSHVLALTSPPEACRAALVSPAFRSAAESDIIWEPFLPPDYSDMLSRAVDRVEFSSKRELYFRLCDSILIDGGMMSFFLERSSGKKCFMLSARALKIKAGDKRMTWVWVNKKPENCKWVNHPESRFHSKHEILISRGFSKSHLGFRFYEVAEVSGVSSFEIRGRMNAKLLSRHTTYAAYIVYKFERQLGEYRFGRPLQETSVELGAQESRNTVVFDPSEYITVEQILVFPARYRMHTRHRRLHRELIVHLELWMPHSLIDQLGLWRPHSLPEGEQPELLLPHSSREAEGHKLPMPHSLPQGEEHKLPIPMSPSLPQGEQPKLPMPQTLPVGEQSNLPMLQSLPHPELPMSHSLPQEEHPELPIPHFLPQEEQSKLPMLDFLSQEDQPKMPMPHSPPQGGQDVGTVSAAKADRRMRNDGWLEMELGEFDNREGDDGDVMLSLAEDTILSFVRGIIIEGIELRPKH